jgi:iron only hydrogenase large subunit-like protein
MFISFGPTGAISSKLSIPKVLRTSSQGKILILQVTPSCRISIGECFGEKIGQNCTGKLIFRCERNYLTICF